MVIDAAAHHVVLPPEQTELLPPVILQTGLGLTVTVKVHVEELPHASVAVEVTVVIPRGKVLPEAGEETTVNVPEQISVAATVKLTTLLHSPLEILAGQVMAGGVTSTVHVNTCAQVEEFPQASVAV